VGLAYFHSILVANVVILHLENRLEVINRSLLRCLINKLMINGHADPTGRQCQLVEPMFTKRPMTDVRLLLGSHTSPGQNTMLIPFEDNSLLY
jgi:hypothetical protein